MRRYKLASFIDPYRFFSFENPRYRFTPRHRYGVDTGVTRTFKMRPWALRLVKNLMYGKPVSSDFFGTDYSDIRCIRNYLSRFHKINTLAFNPFSGFKHMLDNSLM